MNAIWELGCANQKMIVTRSAARFASQARIHGRISTRRTDRERTTKNTAIISSEVICAVVLQRQRRSSMPGDDSRACASRLVGEEHGQKSQQSGKSLDVND